MKRFLLALTMAGFLLPLAPRAQADTEVSLDLFYDNLAPYGNWIEVGDYGYCFQPNVAVSNSDWRPLRGRLLGLHRCGLDLGLE